MVSKEERRATAIENLKALSTADEIELMQAMVKQITALPEWQRAKTVVLTLAQDFELPTSLLIQTALIQGKQVGLPRVKPKRQMEMVKITTETEYARHKFGMLEPMGDDIIDAEQVDFVLVPGLFFTGTKDRIGFGGGYYDRWLPKTKAWKVAVTIKANYAEQPDWETEKTDIKLDQILILDGENNGDTTE